MFLFLLALKSVIFDNLRYFSTKTIQKNKYPFEKTIVQKSQNMKNAKKMPLY